MQLFPASGPGSGSGSPPAPEFRTPAPGSHRGRLVAGLLHTLMVERGPGATVLDCGGGTGALAVPLAATGAHVTVVDRSIDALALLVRRATEAGVADRVTAWPGDLDADDLGLTDELQFDLVVAHDVLTAVADADAALGSFAARVAPGGWLSLQVVNRAAAVLGRALAGDVVAARQALDHPAAGAFDLPRLRGSCDALGLVVEQVHGIGVLTEYVAGPDLEAHGAAMADLSDLEDLLAGHSPYLDVASRLHVLARRPEHGG